jgi:hypothetical protein
MIFFERSWTKQGFENIRRNLKNKHDLKRGGVKKGVRPCTCLCIDRCVIKLRDTPDDVWYDCSKTITGFTSTSFEGNNYYPAKVIDIEYVWKVQVENQVCVDLFSASKEIKILRTEKYIRVRNTMCGKATTVRTQMLNTPPPPTPQKKPPKKQPLINSSRTREWHQVIMTAYSFLYH